MRIVFAGGGTAGHILPGIAVIQELTSSEAAFKNPEILYVGEKDGLEEKICKKNHISFRGIRAGKFRRYFDIKNFVDLAKMPVSLIQSLMILRNFKPDKVFAKGGYVSFPVALAAVILMIPLYLHESDVSPGLTTKMLAPFAKKIFLSFPESKKYFQKYESKVEISGIPVRKQIFEGKKEKGFELTGFSHKTPVVLVMGGSTGAQSLNKLLWGCPPRLLEICQVIHITGPGKMEIEFTGEKRYKSFEYVDEDLAHLYAVSDLIVSRAGASAISEILALQKPNILVPLGKHASRGDQILNAEMCEKNGWSEIFSEQKGDSEKFFKLVSAMLGDRKKLEKMEGAMSEISVFLKKSRTSLAKEISE